MRFNTLRREDEHRMLAGRAALDLLPRTPVLVLAVLYYISCNSFAAVTAKP